MSKKEEYVKRTEEYLLPIVEKRGFELYDVEFEKEGNDFYLRAYIEKPGGITINDCVDVSREMNEILDREDYIKEQYIFEVSSPGLDRPLKKDKDFQRNIGKNVDIKTYKAFDKQKEFTGVLSAFDKDTVTITFEDGDFTFQRKDISLIRLTIDF